MDNTAIHPGAPPATSSGSTAIQSGTPPPRTPRAPKSLAYRALEAVADLRITVVLFVLSLLLVFYGTLAQQDNGTWTAVSQYFRSLYVLIPFNIVFLKPIIRFEGNLPGFLPYPGGWLLGGALFFNLIAAHTVSFKVSWKRSGILMIHSGIVVMMLSELVTYAFAVEGQMFILQGESSNYVIHIDSPELAVIDASDLKKDRVTVVPKALLRRGGLIQHADLPFDVDVTEYMVNSGVSKAAPGAQNAATKGVGLSAIAHAKQENTGVDSDGKADNPSIYATLKRKDNGQVIGTYLFSVLIEAQPIEVDGKTYDVILRLKHTYKSYTFKLDKLNVEYYPRTDIPKDFSSFIHLTDKVHDEDRDIRIYMNHPLHYNGETFYQSRVDTLRNKPTTILQVVRNPGWMLPYLSCFMVATGMLIHFGIHLHRFIERRAA